MKKPRIDWKTRKQRQDEAGYGVSYPREILENEKRSKKFIEKKCRLCGGELDSNFWLCKSCMPNKSQRFADITASLCEVCRYENFCVEKVAHGLPVLCEGLDEWTINYCTQNGLNPREYDPPNWVFQENNT